TGWRVTPQLDFVPFRVPQFALLAIALRPPRRPDFVLDLHALACPSAQARRYATGGAAAMANKHDLARTTPAGGPRAQTARVGQKGHNGPTPRAPAAGYSAAHSPAIAGFQRYRSTRASPRAASYRGTPGLHTGHNIVRTWSPGPRRPTRRDRPRYTHR